MLSSKKMASAAAVAFLGGFALLGLGAAQAVADDGVDVCVDEGDRIRCVQSQTCSGGETVQCGRIVIIDGKRVEP